MQMAQAPEPVAVAQVSVQQVAVQQVARQVQVGDVIFIRVPFRPFREVADATLSWTNHVGVVVSTDGDEPRVAESTFPLSRFTPISRFIRRSEMGRVAVMRWHEPLNAEQRWQLHVAAQKRIGIFYDTGFNLHSGRQFCSKFVREVVAEATGRQLGEVESFQSLLKHNPNVRLGFWKAWYFGRIPWTRQTVSPASMLRSTDMWAVFDGHALASPARDSATH